MFRFLNVDPHSRRSLLDMAEASHAIVGLSNKANKLT